MKTKTSSFIVILGFILLCSAVAGGRNLFPQARAVGPGLVCLDVSSSTTCPGSPASFSSDLNTTLVVNVNIQGSDAFNGFDIRIKTNNTILKALSVDTSSTILPASVFVVATCIDGVGGGCAANDGPGTIREAAVSLNGLTPSPSTGLLFSVTYRVVGTTSGVNLNFQTGCTGTTSVAGTCVILTNPTSSGGIALEQVQGGSFSNLPSIPDFTLSSNPLSLTVAPGSSTASSLLVSSLDGFNGPVDITAIIHPTAPGTTANVAPSTVLVAPGGSSSANLTIVSNSTATLGTFLVNVTASGSGLAHFVHVALTVSVAANFSFHDDLDYSSISQFESAGWVILATNAPASYYGVGGGLLTLLNDGTVGGSVAYDHAPAGVADWTATVSGEWIGNTVGSIQLWPITIHHAYNWEADGFYHRWLLQRDGVNVLSVPGYQPTLNMFHTLRADMKGGVLYLFFDGVEIGTYQESDFNTSFVGVHLQGSWNTNNSFDFVEMAALDASKADFTISAHPSSLTAQPNSAGTSTLILNTLSTVSGVVSLSSLVSPPGITLSFNPTTVTLQNGVNGTSTLTASSSTPGTYVVTLEGTSGSVLHSTTVTFVVASPALPGFAMSATPASLTIQPSHSSFSTITVASVGGFTGEVFLNVSLTSFTGNATATPRGVHATLNPSTVSLLQNGTQNATLTFTVLSNATLGTYGFNLEGSSGSLTHFVTFTVTIGTTQTLGFPFHDDFNYSSLDQLFAAGWFKCGPGPASYYSVGGGAVTLTNDGATAGDICLGAPQGLSNWSYSARVAWVGGSAGGIQLLVVTKLHGYTWIADNVYHRYHLMRDNTDVFSVDGFQSQINGFHDLRLDAINGLISAFFDGQLMGTFQEPDPTVSVDLYLTASWNTINAFDSADGAAPPSPPPDFAMSAAPSSLTIQAGMSGRSTISVSSLNGFVGKISLTALSPSFGLTSIITPSSMQLSLNATATTVLSVSVSSFESPGTFSVKVTGSSGAVSHSVSVTVTVTPPPPPPPDFGISTFPNSMVLIGGGSGTGAVSVSGLNFTGNVQLSSIVTPDLSNGPVSSVTPASVFITPFQSSGYAVLTISTTSATPTGNYTITITGTSGALTHAVLLQLTVLPPPVLTVSPSSGRLGDMVTIHGSGFFVMPGAPIALPVELEITFDSPLLGVVFPQNGSFTFVFNVPHADPTKLHHIHAIGLFPSNLDVQANFTVLPEPASSTPGVSLSTGSLYFPGDTLTIYIQTTQNGALVGPAGVQLQVSITWPNGTSSALNPVSVGTGLYKASFTVPKNGSTGTYAVTATVSVDGTQASALDTFEVKPAWVSPGGPTILSALSLPDSMPTIAILGMIIAGVAVLGLAFLTRKVGKSEKQTLPLK